MAATAAARAETEATVANQEETEATPAGEVGGGALCLAQTAVPMGAAVIAPMQVLLMASIIRRQYES